jgi:hypothetical protein
MTAVMFPDIEAVLVRDLPFALAESGFSVASGVRVATIKPAPDESPYPSKIVVVRGDGGPQLDHVRKLERVGITIWADTYRDASELARLVEALVKQMTGDEIKLVDIILSPVRVDEEGPQQCRYMTIEVITKGTNI